MDWGTLVGVVVGGVLGGGFGVGATLLTGRQARAQTKSDRDADLARREAVELLGACSRIWRGNQRYGVPFEDQGEAVAKVNAAIHDADRATHTP